MVFDSFDIKSLIRPVIDFPKPGVIFRDITPLFQSPTALRLVMDSFAHRYVEADFTHIGAMDARGFSANQFRLSMSRNEIGNYLGLAVETVSRVFTRFQQNELIAAEGKEIHILDPIQLCALAGGSIEG